MNLERAQRESELAGAKAELGQLNIEAAALLADLRLKTDAVLADSFTDMKIPEAMALMGQIAAKWNRAKSLEEKIARLNEALGN